MKREIYCVKCMPRLHGFATEAARYGEWVDRKSGKSSRSMRYDFCNAEINPGDQICCVSFALNQGQYYDWSGDYLQPETS